MNEENTDFYDELLPWFNYKVTEFSKEGYDNIEAKELYFCFKNHVWKHSVPSYYYQRVFDIMNFTVNDFFDFKTLEAQIYQVSSLDEINFEDFL